MIGVILRIWEDLREYVNGISIDGIKDWIIDNPFLVAVICLVIVGIFMYANTVH